MGLAMPAVSQALQGAAGYVAAGGCLSAGNRISERAKDQTLVCEVTTEGKAGLRSQVTMDRTGIRVGWVGEVDIWSVTSRSPMT